MKKMSNQIYNWKRFWCPRTGRLNLSDGGYLYDPDSEWGSTYNPDVVPFESIANIPCLVLLGEPGIGKTTSIQAEYKDIDSKIKKEGDQALQVDLREYQNEDRLVKKLFESTEFISWIKGQHNFHIFLDSLDECLLRIDNISALLIAELKNYPVERLYLRIACRTADWSNSLENGLRELWGDNWVRVYELAPLRRIDVVEAAKANGLDYSAFLREIDRMKAVPLAIKPVTLGFLLNNYRQTGQFPPTQAALYLEGCRLLCEETNEGRRAARLIGTFTAKQRMVIAARMAAVTVFANRYAIWTGVDQGDVPNEDVTIEELCGRKESVDGDEFEVSESAVKEALSTGLFSSRGPNRMGWIHQTYAEFLAAWYLVQHEMTLSQMMSLIVHPGDPDAKLVPQLHETAAWLAGMVLDVFREIMRSDPEVLLRSDVATADIRDREALVDNLLRLYDEEKLLDPDWDIRRQYRKLAHPSLTEQVRPYICDPTKGTVVRRVAIDIAEYCELQTLQDDLARIALDLCEPLPIRGEAAYAVVRVGDNTTKAKLKPLALGEAGNDPYDQLKGCGLKAIWPNHITVEELFSCLTPPKQINFYGSYHSFLSNDLAQRLTVEALPTALRWISSYIPTHTLRKPFQDFVNAIMCKAWENLEVPEVLENFAKTALLRLRCREEIIEGYFDEKFRTEINNSDEKRQRLIEAIIPMLSDPVKDPICLIYSQTSLIMNKDVPWMVERLLNTQSEERQRVWVRLIRNAFDFREPRQLEAVFVAKQNNPIFAETFAQFLDPVEIGSPEAQKMKTDYLEMQEWHRKKDIPLLEPPPSQRILVLLDEFESGNLAAWWLLNREMTLKPNSTHYGSELESDLTVLPGWKTADALTRSRILEAAKKYILEGDPETHKWLGTDTYYPSALAGFRALRLMQREAISFASTIPAMVWKKWAPIILAYPELSDTEEDEEIHQNLVKMAYDHAPTELIQTLMILIDKENEKHNRIFITSKIKGCWNQDLSNALLTKTKEENLKPACLGSLLSDLLDHGVDDARVFAESLITLPIPSNGGLRSRAVVAGCVLMNHAEDSGWLIVWLVIQQDTEFGRELIASVAHDINRDRIGQQLTENQLADLYIWLVSQYPHSEDLKHVRDDIADFRDSILRHLKQRGTHQACETIRRIARELPELDWLKWTLFEAQNITRHRTWMPPKPADILKIASNQQGRLVQSGDQLLDVLIESLKRLEAKLQGETPAAIDLWNEISKNVYRPRDENRFSDYVKRHLDEDLKQRGVIVNREVEIRRGEGITPGERTDIHVDAVVLSSKGEVYDSVSVIIEVKGCWNPELEHAMKTQLVDRYLIDNRCQHGLYLVGWFNCDQWDEKDYRKGQVPKLEMYKVQEQFEAHATELSKQGLTIKALILNTALR